MLKSLSYYSKCRSDAFRIPQYFCDFLRNKFLSISSGVMAENCCTDVPEITPAALIDDSSNLQTSSSGDEPNVYATDSSPTPTSSEHPSTNSTITLENVDSENSGPQAANTTILEIQSSTPLGTIPTDTGQQQSQRQQQEPVHRKIFQVTRVESNEGANVVSEKLELVTDVSRLKSDLLDTTKINDLNPAPPPSAINSTAAISEIQQYGLAIVDDIVDQHNNGDSSPVVAEDRNDDDHVQNRFKVVKVVSTDPLKKGRWECMDYFDQTMSTTTTTQPYTSANTSTVLPPKDNEILHLQCHNSHQPQFQWSNSGSPTQQMQPPQFPQPQQQLSHPSQTPQSPLQSIQPNLPPPHSYPASQIQQQHYFDISTQPQQVYSQPIQPQTTVSVNPVIQLGSQPQLLQQQQQMVTSQPQPHQIQAPSAPQQGGHMLTAAQQQQILIQQQQQSQQQSLPSQQPRASGTAATAVAIDNKIEQAMDLVKSHLMFAVREEVEVLKEKISELMERITLLENENAILKANATQETLSLIQSSKFTTGGNSNLPNNS